MPSTFTWLDHSDTERRRVLEAIDRFKESDTRDELGIGAIRDTFANTLFPGTNVLLTRARYVLFIPWMYRELERKGIAADAFAARARKVEIGLIDSLLASHDPAGTFGRLARGTLKRLPSNIYWLGLGTWRIRLFAGAQDDYHRGIDRHYARSRSSVRNDDGDIIDGAAARNWNASLPEAPDDFPKVASFDLLPQEAQFLTEQIRLTTHGTMLDFLVRRGKQVDVSFPWEHPQLGELPQDVQTDLADARLFAETMQGAALLYNLMLAEAQQSGAASRERIDGFRALMADWGAEVAGRAGEVERWDRAAFWKRVKSRNTVKGSTEAFVNDWLRLAVWQTPSFGVENAAARALIKAREQKLKGARARLDNPRALELWGGESGTARLDYRWRTVQRLVDDIRNGHKNGGTNA